MTYLNWGCDPLAEECQSCLDAICNACAAEFKKKSGNNETTLDGLEVLDPDTCEPDCDNCDLEKKPDCAHCEIIIRVCLSCSENKTCGFRISG